MTRNVPLADQINDLIRGQEDLKLIEQVDREAWNAAIDAAAKIAELWHRDYIAAEIRRLKKGLL